MLQMYIKNQNIPKYSIKIFFDKNNVPIPRFASDEKYLCFTSSNGVIDFFVFFSVSGLFWSLLAETE